MKVYWRLKQKQKVAQNIKWCLESCSFLANPTAHVYKAFKNDFHIQQLPFQRINLEKVNYGQLDN